MGQKGNLITLRKKNINLNLSNLNNKIFIENLNFLKNFKQLLLKKNIIVLGDTLNIYCNKIFLSCKLLFKTIKLKTYKRKKTISLNLPLKLKNKTLINSSNIYELFNSLLLKFKINLITLNLEVLNQQVNKKLFLFLFRKLKPYILKLFSRKRFLFFDFLKITSLCYSQKLNLNSFCVMLSEIFSFLRKKDHSKYLLFLKEVFGLLIFELKKHFPHFNDFNDFKGVKIVINGRLKGKPKASSSLIQLGKIPTLDLSKNIEFVKTRVYTQRYGVFGFKMWIFKN